ncbi:hypothetical protein KKH23_02915 [Patescibacteria group bacterium]|nr:hypothetical protein [Patescibacteria group bacterium]MBU0777303.1 hypothetical protein [Patescibacteria group bacterium]MBU0846117.1 hypothetical protein [Patescibacteria group bacterium]MBU0923171.1 hypothetical protein [Patescibacteria group bacterium]MBU1066885.1 hypothetical protein [Patescibacteria group bacterium]
MAFSITSDMTTIDTCSDTTNWSGTITPTQDTEVFIEGAASVGMVKVSQGKFIEKFDYYTEKASNYYNASTNPTHLYFWVNVSNGGGLYPLSSGTESTEGGVRLYMEDSAGAYVEWYVAGSDTYSGGWRCFVAYTDAAPNNSSGSINKSQIRYFGVTLNMQAKTTANVRNAWIDFIRYGSGLICSGTDTGQMTWDDIYAGDLAGPHGVIRKEGGIFFVQGSVTIGDNIGTSATDFSDANQVLVFEDANVSSTLYNITIVGNATGDTDFQMGTKSGTAGISGCIIRSAGINKYDFTCTDTAVEELLLYGCTFYDADVISLPAYSASAPLREVLNCNFEACNQVDPDTCTVTNCNFINADDRGCLIDTSSHHITDSNFIACPDAVHINTADTYTFSGLIFTNNTYDVENSSAGVVNINVSGTGAASSAENTGGGSTNFISSVDVDAKVLNDAGSNIENAQVYIQKSDTGKQWNYVSHSGNALNDTDFVVTGAIDDDLPSSGWIHVWDKSDNSKQNYRYTGWATATDTTFTLKTNVTGSATSEDGTSPEIKLISTSSDFIAMKTAGTIEEGDSIYNSTDLSWAIVDEIVDADNVTTTPLQGGSDNKWQASDGFSLHKLVKAYTLTDDKIDIPLFNGQTDSNGEISTSYNYGEIGNPPGQSGYTSLPIWIRIRSNQGTPKYIPYNTSGTITGSGYDLTAVITEDDVAT